MSQDASTASTSDLGGAAIDRELVDRELDRLAYAHAVRDFEVANARALDLTERLVDLSREVTSLREQLVAAQESLSIARRENESIRASATFRLSELVRKTRERLRP